jgi:hypothetical protein
MARRVKPAAHSRRRRVVFCIAALAAWCAWEWREWWSPRRQVILTKAYYTVDDGRTWFVDQAERIPPFDHEGRPAVRAQLFSCDHERTVFVGYLQKVPEDVLQKYRDKGIDPAAVDDDELAEEGGWLANRPGDRDWVSAKLDREGYDAIVNVHCPNGVGTPEPVIPREM